MPGFISFGHFGFCFVFSFSFSSFKIFHSKRFRIVFEFVYYEHNYNIIKGRHIFEVNFKLVRCWPTPCPRSIMRRTIYVYINASAELLLGCRWYPRFQNSRRANGPAHSEWTIQLNWNPPWFSYKCHWVLARNIAERTEIPVLFAIKLFGEKKRSKTDSFAFGWEFVEHRWQRGDEKSPGLKYPLAKCMKLASSLGGRLISCPPDQTKLYIYIWRGVGLVCESGVNMCGRVRK